MAGLSTGTTATTTQAKELCIGCIGFDVDTSTDSPTNSFTEVTERASGVPDLTILERIVSATGAYGTTVSFFGATPLTYGLTGCIATFKSSDVDASVNISTSTATAAAPSPSVQASSSATIGLMTASGTMPNVNVQAGVSKSISVSTATATSYSVTGQGAASATASLSTATATAPAPTENHGSSVSIVPDSISAAYPYYMVYDSDESAIADMLSVTPAISVTIGVNTATADAPAPAENHGSSVTLGLMTATANSIDASAIGTSGATRRIIISNG